MKTVSIRCGSCGLSVTVPVLARGMRIHCSSCGQQIVVPKHAPPPAPAHAALPRDAIRKEAHVKDRRRFPRWTVPTLVSANCGLLLILSLVFLSKTPVSPRHLPISNKVSSARNAQPAQRTRAPVPHATGPRDVTTAEEIYRTYAPATVSIVGDVVGNEHLGSGFLVSANGYLLTNYHLVENAAKVHVFTADGAKLKARLVDRWPAMDLALLKVPGVNHACIPLGDSDAVEIGCSVVAIGTPQDLELAQSITQGIISGRRLVGEIPCYQTSTLINHGNSGGPILNMKGEVIGVATFVMGTALVTPQGNIGSDIQGINFAVEINLAREILRRNAVDFQ